MNMEVIKYSLIFIVSIAIQYYLIRVMKGLGYKFDSIVQKAFIISTGILVLYMAYLYGIGYKFFLYSSLIELLMTISIVDMYYHTIRDRMNIIIGILAIINLFVNKNYIDSLKGFLIAGGLFLGLGLLGGIGGGDVKLMACLGLLFGTLHITYIILYSFIIGGAIALILLILGIKKWGSAVAFGPSISIATILFMTNLL